MKNNLPNVIIIILIVIVILVSTIGTFLYIKTDFLKSKEVLFQKYISQNIVAVADIFDISDEEEYIKLLQENDYSESVDASLTYLEEENDEEEVYKIKEIGTTNYQDKESYRQVRATYGDETIMAIDMLNQEDVYGIRIANLVKQFVSVENENLSYFVSSLGFDGQYLSEKLEKINTTGLLNFSDDEIEYLKETYFKLIFVDIPKNSYTYQREAIITLANGQSPTTKAYTLTISENELHKIYKRIINQAINDEIILNKIQKIDDKIQEAGLKEPEGQSLKEKYISSLKQFVDGMEYEGESTKEIKFTVYQLEGRTVSTSIKTDNLAFQIDLDNTEGTSINIEMTKTVEDGTQTQTYTLVKSSIDGEINRILIYSDSQKNTEINTKIAKQDDKEIKGNINMKYSSEEIKSMNLESDININLQETKEIKEKFGENNNILLNDYEEDEITSIIDNLKDRVIANLEKSQSSINSKLLNNILIWIDKKEQESKQKEENNIERQKQKFNNKFELYEGEELEYEHMQNLLSVISRNLEGYQIINGSEGNTLEIKIKEGAKNEEKMTEIESAITDKNKYNVQINYSEDGLIESIDISVYNKE